MRIQDLYRLRNIRATQHVLWQRIETLSRYGKDSNREQIEELVGTIYQLHEKETAEERSLREFASRVEDPEVREVIRLRFIEGMPWADVAVEVAPLDKDITGSAMRKKIERFLSKCPTK